ncbi:hypothetical protein AZI11_03225 [Levilactobacillus brevis]|uniref:TetR/AcrR family transcriptional regulator n=1 Tax=Levilactobacillus brevis TaxID=1580 RepID=UPI000A204FD6|nr:TetR/AcrR family transcriptional regulator [Levilactobacillus brevis]ARN91987.1 hypothetical protein AZI11_03225 [Levilactobacillus brevis]ARN94691.1 hypothetical protein AZI12_03240 [Levilactobacillus brevis]
MSNQREQQKTATRQKILTAAATIYAEQGFTASTLSIAQAAHIAHGTIFVHFSTVPQLLTALVTAFDQQLGAEANTMVRTNEGLPALLAIHLTILSQHEDFYCRLISDRNQLPSTAQLALDNLQTTMAHHFMMALDQTRQVQAIKPLSAYLLWHTWLGLIHEYLLNKDLFAPNEPLIPRYRDELIDTYLALIQKG